MCADMPLRNYLLIAN